MGYSGRLTATTIMLAGVICVRVFAYLQFQYSLSALPLGGIIFVALGYWGGLQYDRACFFAEKDSLTRCHNRRFAGRKLPQLLAAVKRQQWELSLAVLDCDDFKKINDAHGHKMGDQVLKEVAAVIRANLRPHDLVIRWGGDEFVIVAPRASRDDMQKILARLEQALNERSQALALDIRLSAGVASYPDDACSVEALIQSADHAMYETKQRKKMSANLRRQAAI